MDYLRKNPAELLKTQKIKTPIPYHFTKPEARMILKNANPRFKPFFEIMLETRLRVCDMWILTKKTSQVGTSSILNKKKQKVF